MKIKPNAVGALWTGGVALALVVSRWALFPRYLITFDEINFALAVERFDPQLHQPQPPGYPVYVALLKILASFVPTMEWVLLLSGLLLSALALLLLWRLCTEIGGGRCGVIGVLLLLFNPVFWFSSITNPVRLCFAAGGLAVGLSVWKAVTRNEARWLALAAAVLGIGAGARPSLALLFMPLMVWAALRIRLGWKAAIVALLCFAAAVATWLPALLRASGGLHSYVELLRSYSGRQMSESSTIFGAPFHNALLMAWRALAWSCLGTLSWLWAGPFVSKRKADRFTLTFLAVWFFPGLLFFAIFHVADPDHTLSIVPVTCIAGALILTALTRELPWRSMSAVTALGVVLNIFLFFKPISQTAKASTYKSARWMQDYINGVIEGAGELQSAGPLTVVFDEVTPGWRQLSYYRPRVNIVLMMNAAGGPLTTREILGRRAAIHTFADGVVTLPACGTLAWIDLTTRPETLSGEPVQVTRSHIFFAPARPGEAFVFRGNTFKTGKDRCTQVAR